MPLHEFVMLVVVPVGDRLEEALVARGAADVVRRSAARAGDEAGRDAGQWLPLRWIRCSPLSPMS